MTETTAIVLRGFLLDTNVISETRKRHADDGVIEFLASTESGSLFISVLTLGELRKGVASRRVVDSVAGNALAQWVHTIETEFVTRVLPVDIAVAHLWGELSSRRSLPVIDTLIAATAIVHGLTLVTRNVRDMASTGVEIANPWRIG